MMFFNPSCGEITKAVTYLKEKDVDMSDELRDAICKIKNIISSFHKDLIKEGILRRKSISNIKEYNDFLKEWVEGYCVDEMKEKE